MTIEEPRVFLIAKDYEQALAYAVERGWAPSEWSYVDDPVRTPGLKKEHVVLLRGWSDELSDADVHRVCVRVGLRKARD